jgi:nicotinate-nucleotide--dimethylbenzimidazole phosphoribosyltransferase
MENRRTLRRTADLQIREVCEAVPEPDHRATAAAQARLDVLTKPRGSLGQLEDLLVRLAACTGSVCPTLEQRAVLLAAADHGVAAEGVSAYPQEVTAQMVKNFLSGGAAINALAAAAGARIVLVDAGVVGEVPDHPALHRLGIRRGSGNIAREPAMHPDEARAALMAGAALVEEEQRTHGLDLLALGEMGIANTTPAAAITSAVTGAPPIETVGRGTGIDDTTLTRKREVVALALRRFQETRRDENRPAALAGPLALLCELGGLEIAVLAGAIVAAATRSIPVLLDGYITTSAALVAAALAPRVRHFLFAAHCSAEPGHALALSHLGLAGGRGQGVGPLLQLDMRLGEGSGAALAMPLLVGAARLMREMATFEQAGVSHTSE